MGKALSTPKNGKPGGNNQAGVAKAGGASGADAAGTPTTTKSVEGEPYTLPVVGLRVRKDDFILSLLLLFL
jgi:hypothetical protein